MSGPRALALTHVFPRFDGDPSAPFLLTWARALRDAGADLGVVAPHDAGLPGRRDVGGVPVRFVRYTPRRLERLERLAYRGEMHQIAVRPVGPPLVASLVMTLAAAVRGQLRSGRPDVLHVHWWLPGAVAARLARPGAPVVVTVHGTDVALVESRPRLAAVARWALAAADRVEAVSSDLAARLERATGRAADAVNPMPLPLDRLRPPERRPRPDHAPLRVLAVGRMVPEKGFADLIAAVALLRTPALLTIVGDGPERGRLAAQARATGVPLDLPGRLDAAGLRAAYAASDVVVQPSAREGLGLVAAEALVLGLPVVATDSGGVRDLLDDLVPPGDARALADRIAAVAHDPEGARAAVAPLAARARERLSPAAAADRTLAGWAAASS